MKLLDMSAGMPDSRMQPEQDDIPYSAWDMNEGVGPVEERKSILMAIHKPLLDVTLFPWEEKTEYAKLFKRKHGQAVVSRHINYF